MAGKITIRRKGGCFPMFCLLLLFVVVVLVVWLSTAGLPGSVLRCVERAAAEQGIYLHIGKLKLAPSSGIAVKVEDLEWRASATDTQTLATLDKVVVEMRLWGLLSGDVLPKALTLMRGEVSLPLAEPEGERLHIHLPNVSARISSKETLHVNSGNLNVEGISLKLRGVLNLSDYLARKSPEREKSQPLDLPGLIADIQPQLREAYRVIRAQNWQEGEFPSLDISFNAEKEKRATLHLVVPRYDVELFHFRNGEALLNFENDTVLIHELKFHTVSPDSFVRLQGGYDIQAKRLSFRLSSNAPIIRMAERLTADESTRALLGKIRHSEEDSPDVKVSGHVGFTEDFEPEEIEVQGDVSQHRLSVGKSMLDRAELSFYYDNGNFNISKCALTVPDGELTFSASLRDNRGKADLKADLALGRLLALVSEFTSEPISLPEGVELKGNLRASLHADLYTPSFVPGESEWKDLVPELKSLSLSVAVGEAGYKELHLTEPVVNLTAEGVEQGGDMLPCAVRKIGLELRIGKLQWQGEGEGQIVSIGQSELILSGEDLSLGRLTEDSPDVAVQRTELRLQAEQPGYGALAAERMSLTFEAAQGLCLSHQFNEILPSARLQVDVSDVHDDDFPLGKASLQVSLDEAHPDAAQIVLRAVPDGGRELFVRAQADWGQAERPSLQNIEAELPLASFAPVLERFGITTDAVRWPELVRLRGWADYDVPTSQLTEGQFHLSVPELVRTPGRGVPALAGKDVTLSIEAEAHLSTPPSGTLGWAAELEVAQETGAFKGQITGELRGPWHITGHNTIRADVVDALIDDGDAHDIIRDFRFSDASRNIISDIDVMLDLRDAGGGVRVDSFCKAELFNIGYMLSGIETLSDGTERVRQDLGKDPFTYCTRAACSVLVHVVDSCSNADGSKVPNACTITLGNAVLEYDNAPWLRRQGFKGGTLSSTLTGDSVIIDVEHSFVELNNVRGTVYPAYSFGMFYPELQDFMSDVIFRSPAQVETNQCVFPIYSDCVRPMSGTIRALCAEESGFRFIGTTIPLSNFSGFIYLRDDSVQLDQLNATCWEGVLNAVVNIGFAGKHTTFDGYATASAMNLRCIAAAYDNEQRDALCDASVRFRAASPKLRDIEAYGSVSVQDGDLLSLRIFHPVSDLISDIPGYFAKLDRAASHAMGAEEGTGVFSWLLDSTGSAVNGVGSRLDSWSNKVPFANHILSYNLKEAYSRFSIGNGHLVTRGMKAKGSNLKILANLDIDLDTMYMRGNLWPSISSLPAVVLSPLTFLSDFVIDIEIAGPIDKLKWGFGLDRRLKGTEASATAGNGECGSDGE